MPSHKMWIKTNCLNCGKEFSFSPCYNRKYCGRKCLGEAQKGIPLTPEHKEKLRQKRLGFVTPEKTKKKIGIGVRNSKKWQEKMTGLGLLNTDKQAFREITPKKMFLYMIDESRKYKQKKSHINKMKDVLICQICGFSLTKLLEVHHVNGLKDHNTLRKICPNCHFFIHRYNISYEEAEKRIKKLQTKNLWFTGATVSTSSERTDSPSSPRTA